jgi:hypothetical protein
MPSPPLKPLAEKKAPGCQAQRGPSEPHLTLPECFLRLGLLAFHVFDLPLQLSNPALQPLILLLQNLLEYFCPSLDLP